MVEDLLAVVINFFVYNPADGFSELNKLTKESVEVIKRVENPLDHLKNKIDHYNKECENITSSEVLLYSNLPENYIAWNVCIFFTQAIMAFLRVLKDMLCKVLNSVESMICWCERKEELASNLVHNGDELMFKKDAPDKNEVINLMKSFSYLKAKKELDTVFHEYLPSCCVWDKDHFISLAPKNFQPQCVPNVIKYVNSSDNKEIVEFLKDLHRIKTIEQPEHNVII